MMAAVRFVEAPTQGQSHSHWNFDDFRIRLHNSGIGENLEVQIEFFVFGLKTFRPFNS